MGDRKHLIIGCGTAGLSAAEEIRRLDSNGEIKIFTAEDLPPYSPTLLPYLLAGKIDETKLPIKQKDYFDTLKAVVIRGQKIVALDPDKRKIVCEGGDRHGYDTLLIATGARSSLPQIKGAREENLPGFHTFRDCERLIGLVESKEEVTILGAGLVGMALAVALLHKGIAVTIIEQESRILPSYFDSKAGSIISKILTDHGAHMMVGKDVTEIGKQGGKITISFSDGQGTETELMVACTGVNARIDFLAGSGIRTGRGILVNHRLMSSVQDIYAAGDVAEAPGFFDSKNGLNQIIESAVDQGRVAGSNMAGVDAVYEGWIPCNIFHFFGNVSFSAGLSNLVMNGYEILSSGGEASQYLKFVFDDRHLVGAEGVNIDLEPGLILYLMRNKVDLTGHRQMLLEKPKETSRWLMMKTEQDGTRSIQK